MKNEFMNFEVTPDYASPLLDTGFKQLLSLEGEGGDAVAVSFLNALVPDFQANPIKSLKSAPTYMRLTEGDESRPLTMDFNAVNNRGESIIIEIQLKRHIGFDERALFYAARTYSNQINEEKKQGQSFPGSWFVHLKKTYSIQVVGYNSAGAIGIENTHMKDTLIDRVAAHPMKDGDFLKHYVMTDRFSGQEIDYLQLIQLELPRAEAIMNLFPPANGFSLQQWWLSIFNHSKEYTSEYIEQLYKEGIMPNEIYSGLGRM
ncbi:MAG: Rpn family recombination-promoting nuclease/putative transposase, partial [Holosporaceae bacterium]|nr:Rpn family recombination-promoting nuclease/putative transposase [Holosporaceae bacterium]